MDATETKKDQNNPKVMIMAGGTGGHVMPALAVAHYLKAKNVDIHWLGTRQGIEARLVPQAHLPISYISIQGIRGKDWRTKLGAPVQILKAIWQSVHILRREKPDVILSMGGYVSGPGAVAAWLLRCPLVIHEQNAVPGLTNRLLAKLAQRIMVAFPQAFDQFPANKVIWTGNPVRQALLSLPVPEIRYKPSEPKRLKILILGGSQGALKLNEGIPQALALIPTPKRPQVWHQTGQKHYATTVEQYKQAQVDANLTDFIEDMEKAYTWADLVICRAGALTIAELTAIGLPSILIPFPNAADDHQTLNAKYLSEQNAAVLLPQSQLDPVTLSQLLLAFIEDPIKCLTMANASLKLAKPLATGMVAEQCLEISYGA